jgi:acetyltransferase-like isoleucine patch superfamily enzyme
MIYKGKNVKIGENVTINAKKVILGDNVIIKDNVIINCLDTFELGEYSIIASNVKIQCNNFKAGKWLYTCEGFNVGRGGCYNETSNVFIGDNVGIFENVMINPNSEIRIGDNCGIGSEVMIWSHGAWLNPLEGFPKDFGPVTIGKNVWLPARCIVLANVSIGDNVVIGTNSLINKNIPSGSLAAGMPIKILKENMYPKKIELQEKITILDNIILDWLKLIKFKNIQNVEIVNNYPLIDILFNNIRTIINVETKEVSGEISEVSEDFRDFLRRNGIKIYTNNFFKSI